MKLGLEGKTALITAASGGIGSGIAVALADEGVHVAISGRTSAALEQVAGWLASCSGGRPAIVVGDVCAKGGPAQIAAEALAALGGRVDILVNNAGGARPITGEADDAFWDEALTLNFLAARRLTDPIVPGMKAQRRGACQSSSRQLVPNTVLRTRRAWHHCEHDRPRSHQFGSDSKTTFNGQSKAEFIKQNIPAGYFGEPYDIGHLVTFLASPLARYINGAAIPVDGGAVRRV
jgi:3-oxoacyl-[acyl-carrier protein] reductase